MEDLDRQKFNELLQKQQEAQQKQKFASIMGAVADKVGSGQSFGNYWLGKMRTGSDMGSRLASSMPKEDVVGDAINEEKYVAQKAGERQALAMNDPQSEQSTQYRQMLEQTMPGMGDKFAGLSVNQQKEMFPVLAAQMSKMDDRDFQKSMQDSTFANQRAMQDSSMANQKSLAQMKMENDQKKLLMKASASPEGALTEAEKSMDRDYGKQFNKFIATGRNNAANTIQKLEDLVAEVDKDGKGFFAPGGTRFPIPDALRQRKSIEWRDDARNFANKTLKELFGGQLSDAEREAAAREYWNDSLDNESNIRRLSGKIKELRDNLNSQDMQAKYFQENRTLKGFDGVNALNQLGEDDGRTQIAKDPATMNKASAQGQPQIKVVNGRLMQKVDGGWAPL